MKKKRAAACFACFLMIACLCTGCFLRPQEEDCVTFDITGPITSLDPQFATGAGAETAILHCFEGLTRLDADGLPTPAAAQGWSVSTDGLTYTFTLRESLSWSDGTPLTSADFAFAFQRLFGQPQSPWAGEFSALAGASERLEGQEDPPPLGVSTPDEGTLVLQLDQPDPALLAKLASAGAMPVNEGFFTQQKGRYGLSVDNLLFNGPFVLDQWDARQLSFSPNPGHAAPGGFDLVLTLGAQDPAARFSQGQTQLLLTGQALTGQQPAALWWDTGWFLAFNAQQPVFAQPAVRQAVVAVCSQAPLPGQEGVQPASQGLLAPQAQLLGQNYRQQAGAAALPAWQAEGLRTSFYEALAQLELEKMPRTTLLAPDSAAAAGLLPLMQQLLGEQLSYYINLEFVPEQELAARLAAGDFEMAVLPTSLWGNDPARLLGAFAPGGELVGPEDNTLYGQLLSAGTAGQLGAAEQLLLTQGCALPLYYTPTYLYCSPQLQGACCQPGSGLVDVSRAVWAQE